MSFYVRNKYIELVKPYHYYTKLIWMNTKLEECIKRSKKAKDKKVPKNAIESMSAAFRPVNEECANFDEIIEVKNGKNIKVK